VVVKFFLQKSQKFYAPLYTDFSSSFLKLIFNFFKIKISITGVRHVGSLAEKKIRLSTRLAASKLIILFSETFLKKINYLKFVKENVQE